MRTHALPVNYTKQTSESGHVYERLYLSCRGAERQRPSPLRFALSFNKLIQQKKNADPTLASRVSDSELVSQCIEEYNAHPGVSDVRKWQMSREEQASVHSLVEGTSDLCKSLIEAHLHKYKWADSAFTAELLRDRRWLLGSSGKTSSDMWKEILLVKQESQCMFLTKVLQDFETQASRVRNRSKLRLSVEDWQRAVDVACVVFHTFSVLKMESGATAEKMAKREQMYLEGCALHTSNGEQICICLSASDASKRYRHSSTRCPGTSIARQKGMPSSRTHSGTLASPASGSTKRSVWWSCPTLLGLLRQPRRQQWPPSLRA